MGKSGISKVAPIGKRFGRLTVCSPSRCAGRPGVSIVDCACDCGDVRSYFISNLPKMVDPMCPVCRPAHRPARGQSGHPLFNIWKAMIQRCENPKHTHYRSYGGRGISICARWRADFTVFAADVGERPSMQHSIDRIDPDGNYEPCNVRWADALVQSNNRRSKFHRMIEWDGKILTIAEAAREAGVSHALMTWRLSRGWSTEKAMTVPVRRKAA